MIVFMQLNKSLLRIKQITDLAEVYLYFVLNKWRWDLGDIGDIHYKNHGLLFKTCEIPTKLASNVFCFTTIIDDYLNGNWGLINETVIKIREHFHAELDSHFPNNRYFFYFRGTDVLAEFLYLSFNFLHILFVNLFL